MKSRGIAKYSGFFVGENKRAVSYKRSAVSGQIRTGAMGSILLDSFFNGGPINGI
ncbi:hypothetical protein PMAG_a2689 [Pseudoalteromonas mariniglutinosa NCIMB 1770]|nr:hypothetical protein [Pseudoalteromonas mariniglutinosa NCIMB 1770]